MSHIHEETYYKSSMQQQLAMKSILPLKAIFNY